MARSLLGIPRELRRDVAVCSLAFLGLLAGHSMLETARDALLGSLADQILTLRDANPNPDIVR